MTSTRKRTQKVRTHLEGFWERQREREKHRRDLQERYRGRYENKTFAVEQPGPRAFASRPSKLASLLGTVPPGRPRSQLGAVSTPAGAQVVQQTVSDTEEDRARQKQTEESRNKPKKSFCVPEFQ